MGNIYVTDVQVVAQLLAYLDIHGIGYQTTASPSTSWRDLNDETRQRYRERAEWFLRRFRLPTQPAAKSSAARPGLVTDLEVVAS